MTLPTFNIALKECWVYITTPMCYVLLACLLCLTGFFFYQFTLDYQLQFLDMHHMQALDALDHMNVTDWIVGPLYSQTAVFFIFIWPLLTMRLISEERKMKTLDILMASPISTWDIVLGKYVAALLMACVMVASIALFPLLLHGYGHTYEGVSAIDWNTVASASLGLLLSSSACIAIGLFTSSLTESQMVASLLSFASLVLLYACDHIVSDPSSWIGPCARALSFQTHTASFMHGILKTEDVFYFLMLSLLGLQGTTYRLETQRWEG
jgi:ABC-2 type transport system permease protein